MAIVDVTIPPLSESVAEATMLGWRKQAGDAVVQDETLFEIETDKVVFEVPAPASGVLSEITANDGDIVVAGQSVASIDTEATAAAPAAPAAAPAIPAPAPAPVPVQPPAAPAAPLPPPAPRTQQQPLQPLSGGPALAPMPAAAKLIEEQNLVAGAIPGTGKGGRVTKGDVLATLSGGVPQAAPVAPAVPSAPAAPVVATSPSWTPMGPEFSARPALPAVEAVMDTSLLDSRPEERVPMSRLRARIAERLLQSQQSNAILTTFNEVNMQPVMDLRNRYKDKFEKEHGVKLGFMSFFVKAAVHALRKFPVLNSSVDGTDIIYHGYFDIGIAVGSPRGLVVPVLRNVDQMSFADIEKQIVAYGEKAKAGKLSLEELTGGTFSISNGGVFGSMLSTPIINPPQSAILGIHATKERPVVENGQIVIRPMNYFALSYDHRIIDGREAVLGLVAMKEAIEDPSRLLFDL
ncbi:MAG: 2-oxoglutarate dehydrogenase complex dihydrolipoyllysine-residue succinyltransferase [Chlorobiaceae bacterium]|nr:2-oxoglutarate dehydrogenase complex dihydrolipoyllysine-residue succinyltransferase [Chlorobiaceae bacterium]